MAPPTPRSRRTVLGLLLLAGMLLVPAAAGQEALLREFGSVARVGDFDVVPAGFLPWPSAALCFRDTSGNGLFNASEVLYVRQDPCPAVGGRLRNATDLRLSGPLHGEPIGEGDDDQNSALLPLVQAPGLLRASGPRPAPVFLHFGSGNTTAPGDLRLTRSGDHAPGTFVATGDRDAGLGGTLAAFPAGRVLAWDADGDRRPSRGDVHYVDVDGDGDVGAGDVRLSRQGPLLPGVLLGPGDPDVRPRLTAFSAQGAFCFVDRDGDGDYDAGEAVYFKRVACDPAGGAAARLAPGDLRLSGTVTGTFVQAEESDEGVPVLQLPGFGNARYADLNDDGRWSAGDTLYLHTATGRSTVSLGDLRLTSFGSLPGGSIVRAGDSDLKVLTHFGAPAGGVFDPSPSRTWKLWDVTGDGQPGPGDVLYIDVDADGQTSLLDVRLTPYAGLPAGLTVRVGSADARPVLATGVPGASLCRTEGTARIYYQPALCGAVRPGDARLSGPAAGERVERGDGDVNASTSWVPGINPVRFFDADASGGWTRGDTLYVHASTGSGVLAGDLRLTAYGRHGPGTFVAAADDDANLPTTAGATLAAVSTHWRAWDLDRDGAGDGEDPLYLDVDASGTVTPGDVRLTTFNATRAGAAPSLTSQILLLQRTIETLEEGLAAERSRAEGLNATLAASTAEAQTLRDNVTALQKQVQALQAAQADPPPPATPTATPGPEAALLLLAAVAVAVARRRRG